MAFRILHWVSRVILAGVFLYSGYVKLHESLQFAASLYAYRLFPENLIHPIATYFPWVEITLGALLLVGWQMRYFAACTVGLLSMFMIVLAVTYFRGIQADCGCFGSGDRISPLTIARDASFLVPAIFLAAETRIRGWWRHQPN